MQTPPSSVVNTARPIRHPPASAARQTMTHALGLGATPRVAKRELCSASLGLMSRQYGGASPTSSAAAAFQIAGLAYPDHSPGRCAGPSRGVPSSDDRSTGRTSLAGFGSSRPARDHRDVGVRVEDLDASPAQSLPYLYLMIGALAVGLRFPFAGPVVALSILTAEAFAVNVHVVVDPVTRCSSPCTACSSSHA